MRLKKYIGTKEFYKKAFKLIFPVVLQQVIISISGYVDNSMIKGYSDIAYAGVSTANRLMFIIIYLWIGAVAGVSVFVSQYYGAQKRDRIVGTIQLSILLIGIISLVSSLLIIFLGPNLLNSFITESVDVLKLEEARTAGIEYLRYIGIGAVFIFANMMIATVFRSMQKTMIPLMSGIFGIFVNIFFNYGLINGKLGMPEWGAKGAAVGTVISNGFQLVVLIIYALFSKEKYIFDIFKKWHVRIRDFVEYIKKGLPIVFNEMLWAISMQLIALYVTMGKVEWLMPFNIADNITALFYVYFSGIATGVAVLVGSALGEGDFEKAKDQATKLIGMIVILSTLAAVLLAALAPALLLIFEPYGSDLYFQAYYLILISEATIIPYGISSILYYILRAGGDTLRAFLIDQLPMWICSVPVAYLLYKMEPKWGLGLLLIYFIVRLTDIIKLIISIYVYKKDTWRNNLTIEKVKETSVV